MKAIAQRHRIRLTRRAADAVHRLDHPGTMVNVSLRDGAVLVCPDPVGFLAAVDAYRGPGWAKGALRLVASQVRQFRVSFPQDEIR